MFWADLSTANLIEGGFNTASSTVQPSANIPQTGVASYMPLAKIGRGNYLFVFSGAPAQGYGLSTINVNNFCLAGMTGILSTGVPQSYPSLSVQEAYSLDKKIDDGMPMTGKVIAFYFTNISGNTLDKYPAGGGNFGGINSQAASPTSCYDNGGGTSAVPMTYSITQNNGAGINCALSFQFQ